MQSNLADEQAAERKELCLSSSSSSSTETQEDLTGWGDPRPPPVPAKPGFVRKQQGWINAMASAQSQNGGSLGVFEDPSKRISDATVFDSMSELGEGLTDHGRKPQLSSTMSVPLVDKRQSKTPAPPPDMEDIEWYHFSISRHVAESILISTGEDGSYLLRDSATNVGEFTLSVRAKNSVKHFPVRWNGQEFTFGFGRFPTVGELVEHFASKPVIGGESGVLTLLKFPYPRCVDEPETYDQIRVHAEWGTEFRKQGDGAPVFAIASKEGYLTKLGYHRKNWRTRWFVLYKNELSYYKTRDDKTALKTINLGDVMDVIADDIQGKQNCFRIITSYRTFFLYAGSAQEAEEWIKILRWKLVRKGRG